jgi:hypothetical protein
MIRLKKFFRAQTWWLFFPVVKILSVSRGVHPVEKERARKLRERFAPK